MRVGDGTRGLQFEVWHGVQDERFRVQMASALSLRFVDDVYTWVYGLNYQTTDACSR